MEIMDHLMRKLLDAGADDAVLSMQTTDSSQIKFSNNKLSTTMAWKTDSLNIFASIKKRIVSTSLKEFSKDAIEKSVKKILSYTDKAKPNPDYNGIAKGPFKYKSIEDSYDKRIEDFDDFGTDYVQRGINTALAEGAKRTAGVFEMSTSRVRLKTSGNVDAEEKGTSAYFSLRAFVDSLSSGHMVSCSRTLKSLDIDRAAVFAAETAVRAKNPKSIEKGNYDVFFEPLPYSNLLDNLGEAASAFNVDAGLSCLKGKIGKRVAGEGVNLFDDMTLPNCLGSSGFDDEGVPAKKTPIIEKGVVKSYLHNTSTAKKHNVKSTGSAGLISPSPSNLVFSVGDCTREELVESIKKGVIITNVWYTRFQNYSTGDFSTIPRDGIFYVENGEIKHAVKGIRISENLLNIVNNTSGVGKCPVQVQGWEVEHAVITPPVVVNGVRITGSME